MYLSPHDGHYGHDGGALSAWMEQGSNPRHDAPSPTSPLSPDGEASSSPPPPSPPPPQGQEEEEQQQPLRRRWRASISYRVNISISNAAAERDDVWSCLVVLVTFWFFASMSLILGFYGSVDLVLGPNCSRLLQANSFFVQDIKVTAGADSRPGPMVYGFYKIPPLDINTTWTQTHNASIPANSHKEWVYYLNGGAQIDISYQVKSQGEGSSLLTLVVAQGKESLIQWIGEPSYPNGTLSWNIIHGNGLIQQKIVKPSEYYIALGNLNQQIVEVKLNFRIQAALYDTEGAYYKCSLRDGLCILKLFFLGSNVAILATSSPEKWLQDGERDEWYVKLSYGPRWVTYFVGSGVMTLVILLFFKIMSRLQSSSGDATNSQAGEVAPERTPLLTNKDDETSSLGSSYESVSHDEEDIEEWLRDASTIAKSLKENDSINPRPLCAICFDAPMDCFFLPCGHCATCFSCGTRTIEEAGTCPICRRKMKKVRKIFAV